MTIKILYYICREYYSKQNLLAFPNDKELRNTETIEQIGKLLYDSSFCDSIGISNSVAWELVHNESAVLSCEMGECEFGWEEVELFY